MPTGYNLFCQQFANMSESFYQEYLTRRDAYEKIPHENIPVENIEGCHLAYETFVQLQKNAISAIIFQALAIEAYINLFGVYVLGEDAFFTMYEPPKNNRPKGFHYKSSIEKLKSICKDVYKLDFPMSEITNLQALFDKRDRLVHNKPRPYTLDKPVIIFPTHPDYKDYYKDFNGYSNEETFMFDKLDLDMEQYKQLQKTIKNIRSAEYELVEEITITLFFDTVAETCKSLHSQIIDVGEMQNHI